MVAIPCGFESHLRHHYVAPSDTDIGSRKAWPDCLVTLALLIPQKVTLGSPARLQAPSRRFAVATNFLRVARLTARRAKSDHFTSNNSRRSKLRCTQSPRHIAEGFDVRSVAIPHSAKKPGYAFTKKTFIRPSLGFFSFRLPTTFLWLRGLRREGRSPIVL